MMTWMISSSILIVAILLLRQLLQNKISRRLQYALWGIVLLRLLVPFSIGETAISIMNAAQRSQMVQDITTLESYDMIWHTTDGTVEGFPANELMPDTPHVISPHKSRTEFNEMKQIIDVRDTLTAAWGVGVGVVLLAFILSNVKFRRQLQSAEAHTYADCPLMVRVTDAVDSPCLFGLLHPAIYLPPAVWTDPIICRHAVAHEETHYHHLDYIWAVLRCIALALHWYNPLVWLAVRLSRQDSELACDEGTIARLGEEERIPYGNTLLDLTCTKRSPLCTATTMLDNKGQLKERITSIARGTSPKLVAAVLAILVLLALALSAFTGAEVDDSVSAQITTKEPPATSVYFTSASHGVAVVPVGFDDYCALMSVGFTYELRDNTYIIKEIQDIAAENYSGWHYVHPTVDYEVVSLNNGSSKAMISIDYQASIGSSLVTYDTSIVIGDANPTVTAPDFRLTYAGSPIESLTTVVGEETRLELDCDLPANGPGIAYTITNPDVCTITIDEPHKDGKLTLTLTCTGTGSSTVYVNTETLVTTLSVFGISSWGKPSPTPDYHPKNAIHPEDIQNITHLRVRWGVGTLFNTYPNSGDISINAPNEKISYIEQLLSNSTPLTDIPNCPMDVTMDIYCDKGFYEIQLASDSCPVWMSEGVNYRYDAPDNTELYSMFAGSVIYYAFCQRSPSTLFPLLPYLNWTHFENSFGTSTNSVHTLIYYLRDTVLYCNDIPTRIYYLEQVLQCTEGLTEEYEGQFAEVLDKLFNLTPGRFAEATLESIPAENREEVIRLLALAWDSSPVKVRTTLEDLRERTKEPDPTPNPAPYESTYPTPTPPTLPFAGSTWTDNPAVPHIGPSSYNESRNTHFVTFGTDGNGWWGTLMGEHPAIHRNFTYGWRRDTDVSGFVSLTFDDGTTEEYDYSVANHYLTLENNRIKLTLAKHE